MIEYSSMSSSPSSIDPDPIPTIIEIPKINALINSGNGPRWSVMIPAYNRFEFLEQTLRSVLNQDPGSEHMQIEVIDNCSTVPGMERLVKEIGQGRVDYFRQPRNLGMVGNWNTCIERSRGQWVHILHDDDYIEQGYYKAMEEFIESHPESSMVFSRAIGVDENNEWTEILFAPPTMKSSGIYHDALYELCVNCWIVCPSVVVKRSVYEQVGGFSPSYRSSQDWDMWLRIAHHGSIGVLWHPYLRYRVHDGALTQTTLNDGTIFAEAYSIILHHVQKLPKDKKAKAEKKGRKRFAKIAQHHCRRMQREKNWRGAACLANQAHILRPSAKSYFLKQRLSLKYKLSNKS
jgi:glycosyltransferase involved in cell wall biosynthesis